MCLGIPAKVTSIIDEEHGLVLAETGQVSRTINVGLLALKGTELDKLKGKWVLLHVGFALAVIDEDEALETLKTLADMENSNNMETPPL